jgi:hypothetical protein
MKKIITAFAIAAVSVVGGFAQGVVEFDNLSINGNPATSPAIYAPDGVTGLNDSYVAELLGGADAGSLQVLGSTLSFFPTATGGAGFLNTAAGSSRTVPNVGVSQTATFIVRAWRLSDGATFAEASLVNGAHVGQSDPFTQVLGGQPVGAPAITPPKLTNLQSFNLTVVPEPSVIALAVLGCGAMLLRRRKTA